MLDDLRHGVRALLRSPAFTMVAVAGLALGVGASTALFSVLNAVLLRPFPYRVPERLVMVWDRAPRQRLHRNLVSPPMLATRAALGATRRRLVRQLLAESLFLA